MALKTQAIRKIFLLLETACLLLSSDHFLSPIAVGACDTVVASQNANCLYIQQPSPQHVWPTLATLACSYGVTNWPVRHSGCKGPSEGIFEATTANVALKFTMKMLMDRLQQATKLSFDILCQKREIL